MQSQPYFQRSTNETIELTDQLDFTHILWPPIFYKDVSFKTERLMDAKELASHVDVISISASSSRHANSTDSLDSHSLFLLIINLGKSSFSFFFQILISCFFHFALYVDFGWKKKISFMKIFLKITNFVGLWIILSLTMCA